MAGFNYHHVVENFSFRSVQDLHQGARLLLPDVERVLPGGTRAHVFPVAGEATLLPHGLVHQILQLLIGFGISEIRRRDSEQADSSCLSSGTNCLIGMQWVWTVTGTTNSLFVLAAQNVCCLVDPDYSIGRVDQEALPTTRELDALNGCGAGGLLADLCKQTLTIGLYHKDGISTEFMACLELCHHFRNRICGDHKDAATGVSNVNLLATMIVRSHHLGVGLQKGRISWSYRHTNTQDSSSLHPIPRLPAAKFCEIRL